MNNNIFSFFFVLKQSIIYMYIYMQTASMAKWMSVQMFKHELEKFPVKT